MYGLPKNFDTAFLLGQTVELVCFSANQVCLHFSNEISITIEGDFSYCKASQEEVMANPLAPSRVDIVDLLEHRITGATGEENGTLTLRFNHGSIVKCFDNSAKYESYQIRYGDHVIIV